MATMIVSCTLNHEPELNKKTRSTGRSEPTPTAGGIQSGSNKGERNISMPRDKKKLICGRFRNENENVGPDIPTPPGQDPAWSNAMLEVALGLVDQAKAEQETQRPTTATEEGRERMNPGVQQDQQSSSNTGRPASGRTPENQEPGRPPHNRQGTTYSEDLLASREEGPADPMTPEDPQAPGNPQDPEQPPPKNL